jgi:hypothetical protein
MKIKIEAIIFVTAFVALALLADAWKSARHDSQQLAATLASQSSVIQQAGDREKQRDSQLAATLASIQTQKRNVHTPQQAAHQLTSVLPLLPLPVSVHDPDLSAPPAPGETPATSISIPQPDLVPLYNALEDCRANAMQNDSLKNDLSDEKSKSTALLHERDSAIAAAHGGTFFVRLKRAAKWFAIGLATGAAVAGVAHR